MTQDDPTVSLEAHPDADEVIVALCRQALQTLPTGHRRALISSGVRVVVAPNVSLALGSAVDAYAIRELGRPLAPEVRTGFLARFDRRDTHGVYVAEMRTIALPSARIALADVTAALQHEVGHALLEPADLNALRSFWPDGIPPALAAAIRRAYSDDCYVAEMASEAYVALISGRPGYDPALLAAIEGRITAS